jgi:hypothetical protein
MLHQIAIRSRSGNLALAVIGVAYILCALVTLFFFDVRFASSLVDRFLQLALVGSALAGALFLRIGARNLGVRPRLTLWRN